MPQEINQENLEQAIDNVGSYFGLSLNRKPKIKIDYSLFGAGECKFKRKLPLFKRHLVINPREAEKLGGTYRVLEHELIHWFEYDQGLNNYPKRPSPHDAFPSHFLHVVYGGGTDRRWLLDTWADDPKKIGDNLLGGLLEPERKNEYLRILERKEPWLREHIEKYASTSGRPTPNNLAELYGILSGARTDYKTNPHHRNADSVVPYFLIILHYSNLLSVYTADTIGRDGKKAVAFLEELKKNWKSLMEGINLSFWTKTPLRFVTFEKYDWLVQQFSDE